MTTTATRRKRTDTPGYYSLYRIESLDPWSSAEVFLPSRVPGHSCPDNPFGPIPARRPSTEPTRHGSILGPYGVEPFVTGGYSLYWGDRRATRNGFNLGGGVNLWVAKHVAVRLEVRGQGNVNHFHDSFAYFVAFRIGVTFR